MYMHSQAEMHNYYFYNPFKALKEMKFPKPVRATFERIYNLITLHLGFSLHKTSHPF